MVLSVSFRGRERLESAFALTPASGTTRLCCVDEGSGLSAMVADLFSRRERGDGRPGK